MELTEDEIEFIEKRRNENKKGTPPPGIGTSRIWAQAKLDRRKFIDEATFIIKEGRKDEY